VSVKSERTLPNENTTPKEIATFLVAGYETSSTSVAWLLWELSKPKNRHIQNKLRSEIQSIAVAEPTMEELNSLSFLDAVIKENLRVNPAAEGTIRTALNDSVVPVSRPYVDNKGVLRKEFRSVE
jgi:cytochrome P450